LTTRIILDPGGSALLNSPTSYMLYEPESLIGVPDKRTLYVSPKTRTFEAPKREGIYVYPRKGPVP
jgi:hypothetical protein